MTLTPSQQRRYRRLHTKPAALGASSVALVLSLLVAGCVPAPKEVPVPSPAPTQAAATPPVAWSDLPLSPGRWTYVPSATMPIAQFGRAGAAPDFTISCTRSTRMVVLLRAGASPGPMTITTSYSGIVVSVQSAADGISTTLPATSDLLDRFAFSRGHTSVAAPGLPLLVLPAWAEPARVIQDCRA